MSANGLGTAITKLRERRTLSIRELRASSALEVSLWLCQGRWPTWGGSPALGNKKAEGRLSRDLRRVCKDKVNYESTVGDGLVFAPPSPLSRYPLPTSRATSSRSETK